MKYWLRSLIKHPIKTYEKYCLIFTARKRSLGQGNMFTGVCLSTGGVPGTRYPPDQVHNPWDQVPPQPGTHPPGTRYTHPGTKYTPLTSYTPSPGPSTPPPQSILLECILVTLIFRPETHQSFDVIFLID